MGMRLRASSANLFYICPAAAHPAEGEVLVNPVDDAGTLGSSVHAACADIVVEGKADLGNIGQGFGLDAAQMTDLRILSAIARHFWEEHESQFNSVLVETELQEGDISGHADLIGLCDGGLVRALDWKTTRLETVNYRPQMMEYLWLASKTYPGECYQYIIVFLRDKTVEVSKEFSGEEVETWHNEYMARLNNWDGQTYCSGGHCGYCPRSACCPALAQKLALTVRSLGVYADEPMAGRIDCLSDDECVDAYERIRMAERMLAEAVDLIKLRAGRQDGQLQGLGKALVLKEQTRQTIKAREAWPIITKRLTEEELAPAVMVSKTALLDAVGAKAPRGAKKREKEMLMEELEAAGAVETSTYTVPKIVTALPVETTETEIQESEAA